MAEHIAKMKGWVESFPADVSALEAMVAEPKLPREARLLGAAALSYLVTRLDLIPDWEETAGMMDDAMVLRVAMALAAEHNLERLGADPLQVVHRLASESEIARAFLGDELFLELRRHVAGLVDVVVRGRHPRAAIDDDKARAELFAEVRDELKRHAPAVIRDEEALARTIRNYLAHKLGKPAGASKPGPR
jgi:uncharacterized membrane protein YkvA (DUF1232 family)